MLLVFRCRRFLKNRIKCQINLTEIKCNYKNNIISSVIKIHEGLQYVLTIKKRTWYDTWLCYLNVFNPFFFLWNWKFFSVKPLGYDKSFAAVSISFSTCNCDEACIEVSLHRKETTEPIGYYYTLNLERSYGIENVSISNLPMDAKQIRRFKLTHIFSTLFYELAILILCIVAHISGVLIFWQTLFLVFSSVIHSIISIYRYLTIKGVKETRTRNTGDVCAD